jgi:hypothetical protein
VWVVLMVVISVAVSCVKTRCEGKMASVAFVGLDRDIEKKKLITLDRELL